MKLPLTLLIAILTPSVSANSYELCCCTKLTDAKNSPDPDLRALGKPVTECNHDATKTIVDTKYGQFAFTKHWWWGTDRNNPKYKGSDYIYATGLNGDDTMIGQKEMTGLCKKQQAGRCCWSPGTKFNYDYKGDWDPHGA
ncbi:hypothetical protein EG327_006759 [Venturia inaequalis]|uniref:Secreted protein n=1 Tax=Venturia inaequalis TaxID=5025 RepID=A0A8H3ZJY8_VENIN|nr:hypothetical protein EG327_006759 [Venturia inaequalis]